MARLRVIYTVQYTADIDSDTGRPWQNEVADLPIPEDELSQYVEDSFEVDKVYDITTDNHKLLHPEG